MQAGKEATEVASVLIFVRKLKGTVGEARRTVHLVEIPIEFGHRFAEIPQTLEALCGEEIEPAHAERLDRVSGAPCALCLLKSPGPPNLGPAVRGPR